MLLLHIFAVLLFSPPVYPATVDVTDISNRAYFDATINEINDAKESISVAMYAFYIRRTEVDNPAYKLAQALIAAHKRGVTVTVYLDSNKSSAKANREAYEILKAGMIDVYFINPNIKLHAKTILIDSSVVIDGSANWTRNAMEDNIEHNVILRGSEFANETRKFFTAIESSLAANRDKALLETVRVSGRFLRDERFGARMVFLSDNNTFRLYLLLLRRCTARQAVSGWLTLDYRQIAQYLDIKIETKSSQYRRTIRGLAQKLKDEYHLADYRMDKKGNLEMRLSDYDDGAKNYTIPQTGYFNLPLVFWDYGIDGKLTSLQRVAYFICLYEGQAIGQDLYWWKGFEVLAQKYHINDKSLVTAFGELEKMDLIEVWRANVAPGKAFNERKANEYRTKELISPKEKTVRRRKLQNTYGRAVIEKASEFAQKWDKDNNLQEVENFAILIKQYGNRKVHAAFMRIAGYSPNNAGRNTRYLKAVIEDIAQAN